MIRAFVLLHPQSAQLINCELAFQSELVNCTKISCGTTSDKLADLSESLDFWPTYASWNSILFESSVILTVWEHADRLIQDNNVAFLHSDIIQNYPADYTWSEVQRNIVEVPRRAISLTAPIIYKDLWTDFYVPKSALLNPDSDPMRTFQFDFNNNVWNFIYKYDPDMFEWAMATQPKIIYSHQFACARVMLDALGHYLMGIMRRLRLSDTGLWTPHVLERMIGLFLVRNGGPAVHTTAFWHHQSIGNTKLYGYRPYRYYKTICRHT